VAVCPGGLSRRGSVRGEDVLAYRAVVVVPQTPHVQLLQEAYSVGVPVLCPSARLVAQWRHQHMRVRSCSRP